MLGALHVLFILMEIIGTIIKNRNISYGTIITYRFGRKEIMCNFKVCVGWHDLLYEEGSAISVIIVLITLYCNCLFTCLFLPLVCVKRSLSALHCVSIMEHGAWHIKGV